MNRPRFTRPVRRLLIGGAAVVALLGTAPAISALGAGSLTASFTAASDWGSGHEGKVTVTNGTDASVATWSIDFTLPAGTSISSSWDADITSLGANSYRATKKSWAGALAPGSSAVWGYIGTGAFKAPSACTINGGGCNGGPSQPPSSPPGTSSSSPGNPSPSQSTSQPPVDPGAKKVVGYFVEWGVYQRNYHVKNIATSGSAAKMTHILYAFGNPANGRCSVYDSFADYEKSYTAADSVDGVADTWDQPLRGSFNQLRKLKKLYPHLKILWSFGGWTLSSGFTQAAQNPQAFADSCYNLVEDPRWADVFDGIDIDWEYPNACGLSCDSSGPNAFKNVVAALRARFGQNNLVTAAITADGTAGGKIDATDYAGAMPNLNWIMPMTYDYFGSFNPQGPTAPHSPLFNYAGIPTQNFNADAAIQKLKSKGVPANKILFGVGFYGRGWTGVTQAGPGGSATGPAPGTYEAGNDDYKVLKGRCPSTGTIGGTAYAKCGNEWWGYDTPATIGGKMTYANQQGLGGAFFWELSGDTTNGELIGAVRGGIGN
ncbi:glycosyl hydrolase family 18 protein [Virgisporangium aurantiacum]|uniref:chitinase n=1 Tax=Virgisporangium aurantiacum TaxID=175570 RepID=A0A8J3ZFP1_9ACTN|nr:glycosyl hydrolase family 18 protein [Virgisporangium aurantiacum]GIJ60488.1 chitinase [Virgisporangium aurantiacum]